MSRNKVLITFFLLCAVLIWGIPISSAAEASQSSHRVAKRQVAKRRVVKRRVVTRNHIVRHNRVLTNKHQRRKKIVRQGSWAAAGIAAGHAAGPAGSATVGVAKYRHDLKAGGRRRTRAIAKIGAPIAAGAVAGPAGTAGYEVVEHRSWIKRHILHRRSHSRRPPAN